MPEELDAGFGRGCDLVAAGAHHGDVTQLSEFLTIAGEAVDLARRVIHEHQPAVLIAKGDRDMVSEVDLKIERVVRAFLQRRTPEIGFLGEEEGGRPGVRDLQWLLDPVDGTANFVKGIPLYAISLALVRGEQPVLGIIDVPADGSRYTAAVGRGAFLGTSRLKVRPTSDLSEATVTLGDYAVGEQAASKNQTRLAVTSHLAQRALRVRMLGSAAIDLAWLARGRTDAAIILGCKPWDVAGGIVLVREAGGVVANALGAPYTIRSTTTIAASPQLAVRLQDLIRGTQADVSGAV